MNQGLLKFNFKNVLIFVVLVIVYFGAAKLGLKLAFINASASAVWPPTGIAIAAILILGYKYWPAIFLGAFLANFTTAGTVLTSLGIASGNTLEGVLGGFLVNRFAGGRFVFEKPLNILKFAILAGIISPLVSAIIGVGSLYFGGLTRAEDLWLVWLTWWLGDVTGALIVAPLIIIWSVTPKPVWNLKNVLERISLLIILIFISQLVFGGISIYGIRNYPIDFLLFPILLLIAFRFGVRDTVTAAFIISVIAIKNTLLGLGSFIRPTPNESLLILQSFMAVVTITQVMVAAVVASGKELDKLKDEFISLASHQLRTPLTTIKWYTEMLLEGRAGKPEQQKNYLNQIYIGNQRMINLVNDLLDVSRVEKGSVPIKTELLDLKKILEDILEDQKTAILNKQLKIIKNYYGNMYIKMDFNLIKTTIQNLLVNAINYSNHFGEINIKLEVKNYLLIEVKDNGLGIPKKSQKLIFTKLYRADNVRVADTNGSGLGLYLVKTQVEAAKGKIWFNSEEGKGTTFFVRLPLEDQINV